MRDGGPATDQCWMVWFRSGFMSTPYGRHWHAAEWTYGYTRREAIRKAEHMWGWGQGTTEPNGWRNNRRKGLVKAVRTTLVMGGPLALLKARQSDE